MEEEEVDSWYDEEKQKIFNKYLENIKRNKNKKGVEKEYKENMRKVREKYIKLYEKSKKQSLMKKKYLKKINKIKDFVDKLKKIKRSFIEKNSKKIKGLKEKVSIMISWRR